MAKVFLHTYTHIHIQNTCTAFPYFYHFVEYHCTGLNVIIILNNDPYILFNYSYFIFYWWIFEARKRQVCLVYFYPLTLATPLTVHLRAVYSLAYTCTEKIHIVKCSYTLMLEVYYNTYISTVIYVDL